MSAPPKLTASGVEVEIAVQPPVGAGVGRILQPALIARACDGNLVHDHEEGFSIFATLVLNSSTGENMTSQAVGQTSVSAQLDEEQPPGSSSSSSSSKKKWFYFIFHPLRVNMAGVFTFTIWVHALRDSTSTVVGYNVTRNFVILTETPAVEKPSTSILWCFRVRSGWVLTTYTGKDERRIILQLRESGLIPPE